MPRALVSMLVLSLLFFGCGDEGDCPSCPEQATVAETIAHSLHGTTRGMAYFYEAAQGGFELLTHVPYDSLSCKGCHVNAQNPAVCGTCHQTSTTSPFDQSCYPCHSRQGVEAFGNPGKGVPAYSDVHRTQGYRCVNCHTMDEVHGDGNSYNSMLDGAIKVDCSDCHPDLPTGPGHPGHNEGHLANIHCTACHVQATVSCQSCHFETELAEDTKLWPEIFHEWMFLVKWKGKIHQANTMTLTYEGQSFLTIAPFYGHSVYVPDVSGGFEGPFCQGCHDNPMIDEYNEKGTMTVVWWDEDAKKLDHFKGKIPVTRDWRTALKYAWVTTNDGGLTWTPEGVDQNGTLKQMLFCEPLGPGDFPGLDD